MEWISVKKEKPTEDYAMVLTWSRSNPFDIWLALWIVDHFQLHDPNSHSHPPLAVDYWLGIDFPQPPKDE